MSDIFSKEKRSEVMRQVRSKGNKSTELKLITIFKENGITGWRRNYNVKGHPDFVFLEKRISVFVDGCFWHGHNCRNTKPKSNKEYWQKKCEANMKHDKEITALFKQRGWMVVRIWECELEKSYRRLINMRSQNALVDDASSKGMINASMNRGDRIALRCC